MRFFISSLSPALSEPTVRVVLVDTELPQSYISTTLLGKELRQGLNVFRPMSNEQSTVLDYEDVSLDGTQIKIGGEDAAPYRVMGTTIGGNHGYKSSRINMVAHGKDWVDVGSIWNDGTNDLVLIEIRSVDELIFSRDTTNEGTTSLNLTHVSGATNTGAVTSTSNVDDFFYPVIQNRTLDLRVDGVSKAIVSNSYDAVSDVVFDEYYEVMDKLSIMTWMIANVGTITANSQLGGTSAFKVNNITRYTKDGNILTNNYEALQDRSFQDIMFVMGFELVASATYPDLQAYIPKTIPFSQDGTDYDFANIQDMTDSISLPNRIDITPARSVATGIAPDRHIYLLDGLGFSMGYLPIYDADPSVRRTRANNKFLQLAESGKIYMSAIDDNSQSTLSIGDSFNVVAYKYFFESSTNRTAYYIVDGNEGDNYLYADWHTLPYSDSLPIPDDLVGKSITLVEKSSNVSYTGSTTTSNLAVTITAAESYGYLILKLS